MLEGQQPPLGVGWLMRVTETVTLTQLLAELRRRKLSLVPCGTIGVQVIVLDADTKQPVNCYLDKPKDSKSISTYKPDEYIEGGVYVYVYGTPSQL